MNKKKRPGVVYESIEHWIVQKSLPQKVLSRKKILEILGELFHVPKEHRNIVLKELIDYGFVEPVNCNDLKILGI